MRELAKKRLNENLKQSVKYLTLVFNDFFILALIFLFGALMFWYAQAMKSMPTSLWFYKPLTGLLLWLPLLTGHLVTLLKDADMQFLFTQDERMDEYLKPMFKYSLVLPFILELLLAGILFPFATIKAGLNTPSYILLILTLFFIKVAELDIEQKNLYFGQKIKFSWISLAALVVSIFTTYYPIIGFAIAGLFASVKRNKQLLFDWRYAIESEKARKDRVYSIFSMFTDVEEKQVTIKRRKYLDFLLPKSIAKENPNLFLYRRSLLRNPEYLNLLVRMTAFAVLISWLVQDWRWALGLSCLVIFLTVYQLLPMATEFDSNIMYRVYPIVRDNRGKDLVKVLNLGLLIQWLLISVFWLVLLPIDSHLGISIAVLFVFTMIINYGYLSVRVKQQKIKR